MKAKIGAQLLLITLVLALITESTLAVITVQIGGATRLGTSVRSRERYSCYWDCDLVGCQLTREDDECAYDCEKICRAKYDYSGRSDSGLPAKAAAALDSELKPKSANEPSPINKRPADVENEVGVEGVTGQTVRLHLPRNVTARNFGIWERCGQDSNTGKLVEHSFSL